MLKFPQIKKIIYRIIPDLKEAKRFQLKNNTSGNFICNFIISLEYFTKNPESATVYLNPTPRTIPVQLYRTITDRGVRSPDP